MTTTKALVLMSLVVGLTAPVLANTTSSTPAEPSDAEQLYLTLKANGDEIPEWLNDLLFPVDKDYVPSDESSREGGETWATAVAITSFPYTDTGNTSDNIHDAVTMTGTPLCTSPSFTTLPAKDVWYKFTLASPTTMTFSLCASPWDTKLAVFIDNAGVVGNVVAKDDDACNSPNGLASVISNCTLPAGNYFIVVDGYGASNQGAYTLNVTGPCIDTSCPAGFDAAYELEGPGLDTNGGCNMTTPAFEAITSGTALCGTTWADANMRDTDWYELVLTQSSTITVNVASVCAPMAAVVYANGCPVGSALATATAGSGGTGTATTACLLPGIYHIAVVPSVFTGYPAAGMWHYGLSVSSANCVHPCDTYSCTPLVVYPSQPSVLGNTAGHTNVAGNAAPDDFYCFTAQYDCAVTFTTCAEETAFDTYLRLWSVGGPCAGGTQLAFNDDAGAACTTGPFTPNYKSLLTYNVLAGQSYVLQVEGYSTNAGIYRLLVDGGCIIVEAQDLPSAFTLSQNVPNPFNPATTIDYSMPETGVASLKVFDVAGRTVATLVNGMVERGRHSIVFDASSLSSGVYFYTLQAGATVETRKMVLMK